jgi:hypothetical protein
MSRSIGKDVRRTSGRIGRNINIALRAERVIASRRLAVMRTQTGMMAFAGLIAGIGTVMISVALFFWLAERYGNATAGLIVAAIDFLAAGVLVAVASRMSAERDLEPVIEVRDLALEDIEAEVEDALVEVGEIAEGLRQVTRDPLGAIGQGLLGPILTVLLKSIRK